MNSGRPSAAAGVVTAAGCAFAMIATQVAGKTARDALFLSHFDVSALPGVLVVSALLSIGAVLVTARAMSLYGPHRVIPPLFLLSSALLAVEWLLALRDERLAAVLVYLHIAVIGSILISGFWSIVNERFDPRTARQSIDRIAGGATAGGLFGGLLAERVGVEAGIAWVLPIVAAFHAVCAVLLRRLGAPHTWTPRPPLASFFARRADSPPAGEGLRVLRRVSFLRNLAVVVLLGNVAATLVDYLFKASAAETFSGGGGLVRFFAVFYTGVSLVTLAVQAGLTRRLIERFGVARTMTVRPALLAAGGLATLPFTGLAGLGILRGLEAVVQGSLFRSAYELTYTPVAPADKRTSKTLIDVGVDRMGDLVGAVLVRAVILLPAAAAGLVLLLLAVALSLTGMLVARALHMGYVRALETSLIDRAHALDLGRGDVASHTTMMDSMAGIDLSMSLHDINVEELREAARTASLATRPPSQAAAPKAGADDGARPRPAAPAPVRDPEVLSLIELRSGDPKRVHAQLRGLRAPGPVIAAQVIALLAWDEAAAWAARVLAKAAPSITGQLIDRLLDPDEDFAIRRRIPAILSTSATPRVQAGLIAALADGRFEVRYHTARALARMHERVPDFAIDRAAVYAAVLRETRVDPTLWANQRLIDEPEVAEAPGGAPAPRANRSLEHVFTMLSLVLPRAPLQIAFKGLLTSDDVLRGTSLEYLESVLPRDAWEALHPFLHDTRAIVAQPRPQEEVLEALMRSSQSIELNLAELKKQSGA